MPTSEPLTQPSSLSSSSKSPCYFLGPSDYIGSFKAKCSSGPTTTAGNSNSNSNSSSPSSSSSTQTTSGPDGHDPDAETASPGLQSGPTNGADQRERCSWVEVGIKALMAMGAVKAAWGWGML
jgi:hypothetical protein